MLIVGGKRTRALRKWCFWPTPFGATWRCQVIVRTPPPRWCDRMAAQTPTARASVLPQRCRLQEPRAPSRAPDRTKPVCVVLREAARCCSASSVSLSLSPALDGIPSLRAVACRHQLPELRAADAQQSAELHRAAEIRTTGFNAIAATAVTFGGAALGVLAQFTIERLATRSLFDRWWMHASAVIFFLTDGMSLRKSPTSRAVDMWSMCSRVSHFVANSMAMEEER